MHWREDSISGQTQDFKFQIPNSKFKIGDREVLQLALCGCDCVWSGDAQDHARPDSGLKGRGGDSLKKTGK